MKCSIGSRIISMAFWAVYALTKGHRSSKNRREGKVVSSFSQPFISWQRIRYIINVSVDGMGKSEKNQVQCKWEFSDIFLLWMFRSRVLVLAMKRECEISSCVRVGTERIEDDGPNWTYFYRIFGWNIRCRCHLYAWNGCSIHTISECGWFNTICIREHCPYIETYRRTSDERTNRYFRFIHQKQGKYVIGYVCFMRERERKRRASEDSSLKQEGDRVSSQNTCQSH